MNVSARHRRALGCCHGKICCSRHMIRLLLDIIDGSTEKVIEDAQCVEV